MRPIATTFLAKLQTSKDLISYGVSTIIRLFEQKRPRFLIISSIFIFSWPAVKFYPDLRQML